MIIDRATADDLDAIAEIERHSFTRPWPRSAFEAELTRDIARLDVARKTSVREPEHEVVATVVAFCNYWIVPDAGGHSGELHILAIATHPDHRRAGAAGMLLDTVLDQRGDIRLATLEVRRGNLPAIALYETAGFRTVHVRNDYYQDNNDDALVMLLDMDQARARRARSTVY